MVMIVYHVILFLEMWFMAMRLSLIAATIEVNQGFRGFDRHIEAVKCLLTWKRCLWRLSQIAGAIEITEAFVGHGESTEAAKKERHDDENVDISRLTSSGTTCTVDGLVEMINTHTLYGVVHGF